MFRHSAWATKYRVVPHDEILREPGEKSSRFALKRTWNGTWICFALSFMLNCAAVFLIVRDRMLPGVGERFSTFVSKPALRGYDTELFEARKAIEPQVLKFTGGFVFGPDGETELNFPPDTPRYVGTPSPQLDANWDELLAGEYLILNASEATTSHITGSTVHYQTSYQGKIYYIVIDVMHELHCVNEIRKYIDNDYYGEPNVSDQFKKVNRLHIEHCIDYIRQTLMCHSDLTPVPALWDNDIKRLQPQFEQVHTCRNFDKIRDWAVERSRAAVLSRTDMPDTFGVAREHHSPLEG